MQIGRFPKYIDWKIVFILLMLASIVYYCRADDSSFVVLKTGKPVDKFYKSFFSIKLSEKSEYETNSDYYKRLPRWDSSKIIILNLNYKTIYNAEEQIFAVMSGDVEYDKLNNCFHLSLLKAISNDSSYFGVNTFGAIKKIEVFRTISYNLINMYLDSIEVMENGASITTGVNKLISLTLNKLWMEISMDSQTAKNLSKQLKVKIAFKIPSYFSREIRSYRIEPTMDDPSDKYYTDFNLEIRRFTIFLIDGTNNKILKSFTADLK